MAMSLEAAIDGATDSPQILYVNEVADEIRRSVDAVRWLINSKQLRAGKLGGRIVVRRADLDAFIASAFEDET